jgi:hypothetical protein
MHARKRRVESFEKMSREGKRKRKKYVYERMKEKEEKEKRGVARNI